MIGAVALATVLLTAGVASAAGEAGGVASAAASSITSAGQPDFGPNVKIFDPSMPQSEIQATLDAIAKEQVDNEMGTQRYALLFKPGIYGTKANPLVFQVGY